MGGCAEAAPHGAEDVAAQRHRSRNQQQQTRQLDQGPLRCGEDQSPERGEQDPDQECDEALSGIGPAGAGPEAREARWVASIRGHGPSVVDRRPSSDAFGTLGVSPKIA